MRGRGEVWRTWVPATVVALVALASLLVLFRAPSLSSGARPDDRGPVATLARGTDGLLSEEAAMRDPTPLYLPTPFNAAEDAVPTEAKRDLSGSFRGYDPKFKYAEAALALSWPPVVEVPQRVADAFGTDKPARPFIGFGQTGTEVRPLSGRTAFVEVSAAADGRRLFSQPVADAKPPADVPWQPLEFLVAVDAGGVVGPPVLTESSRVAAVDSYFQAYLVNLLHLGERLRPGFYRVGIGP